MLALAVQCKKARALSFLKVQIGIGVISLCFSSQSPSHKSKRQQQELIAELRRRQVKDNRHVYEGKDGAIEDIITGKGYFVFVVCSDHTASQEWEHIQILQYLLSTVGKLFSWVNEI